MQIKTHVLHDFMEMEVSDKLVFGTKVRFLLTKNLSLLGTLKVPILTLDDVDLDLKTKNDAYQISGESVRSALDLSEKNWETEYTLEADGIDDFADGNGAIIDLSGFNQTKSASITTKVPATLVNATTKSTGVSGNMQAKSKVMKGVAGYVNLLSTKGVSYVINGSQITFTVGGETISITIDTPSKTDFVNLPGKTDYKSQQAAFNRAGMGAFTPTQDASTN